ncbi:hypothetical protein GCM10009557_51370 [Virgisporangium ochraceum]|uniref:RDD family protein n=1 Tax=Virgisporangium ochraceum TaxID=65505 RepID=A0A8J3ZQD3_9ACTN|nr:RDD family protein [Virgisporangium ochraceum]GIJ66008.1 RDD family protein [Virgisporangium ochraceum]
MTEYGQYPQSGYQMPQYPQGSADHQMQQPAFQVPMAPDGRPLADPGKRLLARILDSLFWFVAYALLGVVVVLFIYLAVAIFGDDSPVVPIMAIFLMVLIVLASLYVYEVELPFRYNGQTPGKRIMKIAIASLEPGVPLRRGQLTYRMLMTQLFNLLGSCYVGLLDPLWCLWDKPYKQCLHDKGPKTVVVRVDQAR